jgi:hypothetical protein
MTINDERKVNVDFSDPLLMPAGRRDPQDVSEMKPALGKKLGQDRTRTVTVALSFAALTVFALFVLIVAFQDQLGLNSAALDKVRTNFINNFIVENRWLWLVDGLVQTLIITFSPRCSALRSGF